MMPKRKATDPSTAATTGRAHDPTGTLGALLFADRSRARIPEQAWVDLVRSVAARDQAALRALYERSHRMVFALTMRIVQNRQTAEELTVDVFHDVWRRAAAYDPLNGPVLGWILNQSRSRAIDRIRYEQRRKRVKRFPNDPLDRVGEEAQDDALSREALARRLRQAVGLLTVDERQAIETTFLSGMTHAEAAAQLKLPLGTLKSRVRSGLCKLREHIADE